MIIRNKTNNIYFTFNLYLKMAHKIIAKNNNNNNKILWKFRAHATTEQNIITIYIFELI